jgi:hypothetical protein
VSRRSATARPAAHEPEQCGKQHAESQATDGRQDQREQPETGVGEEKGFGGNVQGLFFPGSTSETHIGRPSG